MNYNNIKSLKLKVVIVESILLSCIVTGSILELLFKIQTVLPLSYEVLKKYLFYLVDFNFISYNGQKQVYITEERELDLLYMIKKEKKMKMVE
jgi:hypothetical protein